MSDEQHIYKNNSCLLLPWPKLICTFCSKDCSKKVSFADHHLSDWGLTPPMCFDCTIRAIVRQEVREILNDSQSTTE